LSKGRLPLKKTGYSANAKKKRDEISILGSIKRRKTIPDVARKGRMVKNQGHRRGESPQELGERKGGGSTKNRLSAGGETHDTLSFCDALSERRF